MFFLDIANKLYLSIFLHYYNFIEYKDRLLNYNMPNHNWIASLSLFNNWKLISTNFHLKNRHHPNFWTKFIFILLSKFFPVLLLLMSIFPKYLRLQICYCLNLQTKLLSLLWFKIYLKFRYKHANIIMRFHFTNTKKLNIKLLINCLEHILKMLINKL